MSEIPCEDLGTLLRVSDLGEGRFRADLADFWGAPMQADAWARAALAAARCRPEADLVGFQGSLRSALALDAALGLRVEAVPSDTSTSLVRLEQGEPVGLALAGFARTGEKGPEYQDAALPADLPAPEHLPSTRDQARTEGWPEIYARGPLEFRRAGSLRWDPARGDRAAQLVWLKPRAELRSERALDAAAMVFATSFYPHWEFERRIGPRFDHESFRVVDRALHVHQRVHWSDWWLLEARSELARGGRAHSFRRLFARDGRMLASASIQALVGAC